jgi:aminoglycoside phosphotransferase (APT) family kinase protein
MTDGAGDTLPPRAIGVPLATGRTANVYAQGPERVLKLYHPGANPASVERERRNTVIARRLGVSAPTTYGIERHGDRIGLSLRRIEGVTMQARIAAEPAELMHLAAQLASLQATLHARRARHLPRMATVLSERISSSRYLRRDEQDALLRRMYALESQEQLCHGDYHPGNVMLTGTRATVLDWVDATQGDPLADVARTSILMMGHAEAGAVSSNERHAIVAFHDAWLRAYLVHSGRDAAAVTAWRPLVAAARLAEGVTAQHDWLLGVVRAGL